MKDRQEVGHSLYSSRAKEKKLLFLTVSKTEIIISLTLSTRHGSHYQIVSSDAHALSKMPEDSGYEIDKAKAVCKLATHWSREPRASARGYFDDVSFILSPAFFRC